MASDFVPLPDFQLARFQLYGLLNGYSTPASTTATSIQTTAVSAVPWIETPAAAASSSSSSSSSPSSSTSTATSSSASSSSSSTRHDRPQSSLGALERVETASSKKTRSRLFSKRRSALSGVSAVSAHENSPLSQSTPVASASPLCVSAPATKVESKRRSRSPSSLRETTDKAPIEQEEAALRFESGEIAVRVFYEDNLYKILRITSKSTAEDVCQAGAKKLGLLHHTFGLYVITPPHQLTLIKDADTVLSHYDALQGEKTLAFLNKPRNTNLAMRLKVYARWVDWRLQQAHRPAMTNDLVTEVRRGAVLAHLAEAVTGKQCSSSIKSVGGSKNEQANIAMALNLLYEQGAVKRTTSIPVEAVHAGSLEAIHWLLWQIFFSSTYRHVTVERTEFTYLAGLLAWCRLGTSAYPDCVAVNDFYRSWINGLAFGALLENKLPGVVKFAKVRMQKTISERLSYVFLAAKKHARIPILIQPDDFLENVRDIDELSVVICLATWFEVFARVESERSLDGAVVKSLSGSKVFCHIFFEGFKNVNKLVVALTPRATEATVRAAIAKKTRLPPESFDLFLPDTHPPQPAPLDGTVTVPSKLIVRPS